MNSSRLQNAMTMHTRTASVLIMVILILSLMVTMATSFMSMVGRQLGTAVNVAAQTKADVAVQQAQAHVIKTALETMHVAYNQNGNPVPYTTMLNPGWRTEFAAVTDPDGNPFTQDGSPVPAGTQSTISGSTSLVFKHPLVNSDYSLLDMTGGPTGEEYGPVYGFSPSMDRRYEGADNTYISRWYNVEYLDDAFQHIQIDDALSESDKADLRESATYVVRYMAQVLDAHAMQSINHNFPVTLLSDGSTINPGTAAVSSLHYIRYQNYLRAYGRSIKSQFGAFSRTQYRSDAAGFIAVDPLDNESLVINVNGEDASEYQARSRRLDYDARLRLERAFRGGDLQWGSSKPIMISNHKGPVQTWGHISQTFIGAPSQVRPEYMYSFLPFAVGLRDANLADPVLVSANLEKPELVSTPWHINLLSASNVTLGRMVRGLSSELRFYGDSNTSTQKFRHPSSNADLFGKQYPEPFPIGLDEGKYVPLFGDSDSATDDQGAYWSLMGTYRRPGGDYVFEDPRISGYRIATPGYQNSYWMDVYHALALAMRDARQVWVSEKVLTVGKEIFGPDYFEYVNGVNNSYIDKSVTDPDSMINLIIRETYRILGEGRIVSGSPATSENFFIPGGKSLLGGGKNLVGAGSNKFYQFYAQLPPSANTRAMEYLLNDVMISLFGKANPNFDPASDPLSENIAIDFNGDGYAESTVTGWYNPHTKTRYWSWWWDGLGPYVDLNPADAYMKRGGWYRFDGNGNVFRQHGDDWKVIPDTTTFFQYNDLWLNRSASYPIKPFAKTGRLFIGKSRVIHGFVRGEVYNIRKERVMASTDRNFSYHIDPNKDGDYSDSHMLIQTDATLVP